MRERNLAKFTPHVNGMGSTPSILIPEPVLLNPMSYPRRRLILVFFK